VCDGGGRIDGGEGREQQGSSPGTQAVRGTRRAAWGERGGAHAGMDPLKSMGLCSKHLQPNTAHPQL